MSAREDVQFYCNGLAKSLESWGEHFVERVDQAVDLVVGAITSGGKMLAIGPHAAWLQSHALRDPTLPYWPVVVPGGLSDEEMVAAHGRPGDVLIAYFETAPSRHEVAAVIRARHMGLGTLLMVSDKPLTCGGDVQLLTAAGYEPEMHLIYTQALLAALRKEIVCAHP